MKSETANLPRSVTNNLRITSLAILLIGVYLIIPKTATTTAALSEMSMNQFSHSSENITENITMAEANSVELAKTYTPPNYGGPDTESGSGTR
ncbi:hypothetical protein H6G33_30465 [Calothrix sp. FACHB-1219]|uniref:hypothetical protein n=1 Tax=unclassified Calothrix TaxID=2619626 RepID=UPI00168971E2|nr:MULTISPECIES: hypothetical protein [unclassified Calothrix]MBD2206504.1 hypothetical protein [Calothrix sp. FACHB-168]MBD2221300.1 hypothetical protein [Calothrix sp. FACHB-1219]